MEIIKSEGCTAYYTLIDQVDATECTPDKLKEACIKAISTIDNSNHLNYILNLVLEYSCSPKEHKQYYCEQCVDYNDTYTYEI